jgi:hypothetical protein
MHSFMFISDGVKISSIHFRFESKYVNSEITFAFNKFVGIMKCFDRLCCPVVRVLGYRSGGPGSIPGTTRKKLVGLERGALSLVSTTEDLLDRKVAAPV